MYIKHEKGVLGWGGGGLQIHTHMHQYTCITYTLLGPFRVTFVPGLGTGVLGVHIGGDDSGAPKNHLDDFGVFAKAKIYVINEHDETEISSRFFGCA